MKIRKTRPSWSFRKNVCVLIGSALLNCAVCNYPMEWSAWKCDVNCNVVSQADYGSTINYTALLQRLETLEAWKVGRIDSACHKLCQN